MLPLGQLCGGIRDDFKRHLVAVELLRERVQVALTITDLFLHVRKVVPRVLLGGGQLFVQACNLSSKLIVELSESFLVLPLYRFHFL